MAPNQKTVAASAFVAGRFFVQRLPNKSSVYSAELTAICLALEYIVQYCNSHFVIFSDSLSSLQALQTRDFKNPLLCKVMQYYMDASQDGNDISFCWVPSHVGIWGNEIADWTAKAALQLNTSDWKVPASDFRRCAQEYIYEEWETHWLGSRGSKLHQVQPHLGEWKGANRSSRLEEVVLARLRIGHTRLTHSYLLKGEPAPICDLCGASLTVEHILIKCVILNNIRRQFYQASSLLDLFTQVDPTPIIGFLKCSKLLHSI